MKLFDQRGKVFGLINILDLFLVIVLLGAIIFAGIKYTQNSENSIGAVEGETVSYVIYNSNSHPFVIEKIKVGDVLRDVKTNVVLGEITNVDVGQATHLVTTADGRMVNTTVPEKLEIYMTMEVEASIANGVATVGATQLLVGNDLSVKGPEYMLPVLISDVQLGE